MVSLSCVCVCVYVCEGVHVSCESLYVWSDLYPFNCSTALIPFTILSFLLPHPLVPYHTECGDEGGAAV